MELRDVEDCARCGGEHRQLAFKELTKPVQIPVGHDFARYTHWAPCPSNAEPVLLRGARPQRQPVV